MNAARPKSRRRAVSRRTLDDNNQESLLVRELGLQRLHRFASLNSKVKTSGKPKVIHDVRVASRRLQQILDYLYPAPRPTTIRRLRKRLRRLRQTLGEVRDYDVYIATIDVRLKSKERSQPPILTAIQKRLTKRRAKLIQKAHAEYDKHDALELCEELQDILRNVNQPISTKGTPPTKLDVAVKQVWRNVASDVTKSLRKPRPANLHRVRIKIKRLRYLLEVVGDLGYHDIETALMCLRRLQQHLGHWHDLEVQEEILLKITSRRPNSNRTAKNDEFLALIHEIHVAKADAERKYLKFVKEDPAWRRLRQWITNYTNA